MNKFFILNKKEGETPLEVINKLKLKHKKYKDLPMTYAGRLDPMAYGIMIVLAGEECKKKDKYLKLSKEYEFEILFGFSTDTYDILGKVISNISDEDISKINKKILEKEIKKNLKFFKGEILQKYPEYSSKTVKGKPLFSYARAGEKINAPSHKVSIKYLRFLSIRKIGSKNLLEKISNRIKKVSGDFRQKEISKIWYLNLNKDQNDFFIGKFKISCSSGTYVRGIANTLGEQLSIPSLAFSIKRTKIGKWSNI